ncbi:flap endonuclease GEN [Vanessa atalanta]|uniref:flap endonuclease GEN n=1 Tax=Vanessa atalanta TaxID=42275 RepID=UPI001FCCEDF0|nr:flap endonuclease GEN [Vanessa atalanta]
MGIKGLWTVLTPFSEKKSLHEIRGETVAVDLSGWVCDSQNVTDYYIQPKLYLRNLFFRTVYLLLADISPVFVLEGEAPELKQDVMAARNAIQFRGAAPKSDAAKAKAPNVSRKRFKGVLKECETLLKSMGVRCVKGRGEAEATCARLNAKGLVDAVVSQDSDCFAYGAKRVYRNFSVSSAAGGGAMQGSVDCYDAEKMFNSNGFGRKKMVALALLCGCDYGVGACGSSITTAVAFLHTVPEDQIIFRLLSWVSDPQHYEEQTRWSSAPGRCDRCGHVGRTHAKNGCPVCVTHRGCTDVGHKSKVAEVKRELSLRNRALSSGMPFPEPKVMKEFLDTTPEDIDLDSLKIPTPSLIQFVKIMSKKLDWSERYCVEKFLPLLTKWHLQEYVTCRTIKPIEIKKKRNPRGVPSYEVLWADIDGQYDALIPDDQFEEGEDTQGPWTSIERQDLMRRYYPDLVEKYEESIKKPPKEKKTRGRKKKDPDSEDVDQNVKPKRKYNRKPKQVKDIAMSHLNESMKNLSLTNKDLNCSKAHVSVCVNRLKRKMKNSTKTKVKNTIDSYLKPLKKRKSKLTETLNNSVTNIAIANNSLDNILGDVDHNKENISDDKHLLSILDMSAEDVNDIDLSDIVDTIVSRAPKVTTTKVNSNLVKLIFENKQINRKSIFANRLHQNCSTPKSSPVRKRNMNISKRSSISKVNTSYFFDKITDECDAFEMSLEYKYNSVHLDCDATVNYSLPKVCL